VIFRFSSKNEVVPTTLEAMAKGVNHVVKILLSMDVSVLIPPQKGTKATTTTTTTTTSIILD
jgi:hypothetical protein